MFPSLYPRLNFNHGSYDQMKEGTVEGEIFKDVVYKFVVDVQFSSPNRLSKGFSKFHVINQINIVSNVEVLYKIRKLSRAIFSAMKNILPSNFAILLIFESLLSCDARLQSYCLEKN